MTLACFKAPSYNRGMNLPAYDVVIPCFNRAHVVADAVASALAQTHGPTRVVVVDDHSNDDGHDVARRIASRDGRVTAVRHEANRGASTSRNTGAALCSSPWIAFLDSDDVWTPGAAEHLIRHGLENDLDVVVGMFARVVGDGEPGAPECGWTHGTIREALRTGGVVGTSWTVMRRSRFDAVGGFDPSFHNCNDWDFFTRVAAAGARYGRCDELVAHYRTVAGDRLVNHGSALAANGLRVLAHPYLAPCDQRAEASA